MVDMDSMSTLQREDARGLFAAGKMFRMPFCWLTDVMHIVMVGAFSGVLLVASKKDTRFGIWWQLHHA